MKAIPIYDVFNRLKNYFRQRNRIIERQCLSNELETIYRTRQYFDRREKEVARQIQALNMSECVDSLPIRVQRGW